MRVLLVDDNPDLRHLLALDCTLAGIDVVAVGGYDEALVALRRGGFDALVTDRFLDDGDGEVLAHWAPVPAVVISGSYTAREVLEPGVVRLPKPFRPGDLVDVVLGLTAPALSA